MRIVFGSDHAGIDLKAEIMGHLRALGHECEDVGTCEKASTDYPVHAKNAVAKLVDGEAERCILICGTGQGVAMTANKVPGVRAAVVADTFSAAMAMQHNNAKVLCLGARVVGAGLALRIVDTWLAAEFEGGRHARRVQLFDSLDPHSDN